MRKRQRKKLAKRQPIAWYFYSPKLQLVSWSRIHDPDEWPDPLPWVWIH